MELGASSTGIRSEMIGICILLLMQVGPEFDRAELAAQKALAPMNGSLKWVVPDPRESKDDWVLSLDVENKGKTFDVSVVQPLKRLYALRILGGRVEEKSLVTLAGLPRLGLLVITGDGVTDKGLRLIAKCRKINKLDVSGPKISAFGLRPLAKMTNLRRVFFYNTKLKDADLKPFETMTFLDQLVLPDTVSPGALQSLANKLPKTQIERMTH